jgi:hypothetical protein
MVDMHSMWRYYIRVIFLAACQFEEKKKLFFVNCRSMIYYTFHKRAMNKIWKAAGPFSPEDLSIDTTFVTPKFVLDSFFKIHL